MGADILVANSAVSFENPNYFTNMMKKFNPSYTYCFYFSLDFISKEKIIVHHFWCDEFFLYPFYHQYIYFETHGNPK